MAETKTRYGDESITFRDQRQGDATDPVLVHPERCEGVRQIHARSRVQLGDGEAKELRLGGVGGLISGRSWRDILVDARFRFIHYSWAGTVIDPPNRVPGETVSTKRCLRPCHRLCADYAVSIWLLLLGYQWLLRLRVDCMVTFSIPTLPCVPSFPVGSPPFIGQREGAEHTHLRMCTPLASTFLTLPATFRFVALSPSTHAIPFLSCFRFHQRVINTSHASCRLPLTLPLSFVLPLLSSTLYFHTAIIGFVISTSFCPFVLLSLRLGTLTGSLALRLAIIDPHCCLSVIRLLDNFLRLITSWKHYRHALVLL